MPLASLRRRWFVAAMAAAGAALGASGAAAQSPRGVALPDRDAPVALVADRVLFDDAAQTVTAQGSVEVVYGARTLTADEIVYDARAGRIRAQGPLVLRSDDGTVVFADAADLDADLRDGLIAGARALIGEGGAVAAVEGRRVEGRYHLLSRAVFSTCEVCPADPTPLWAVRARRVVHDEAERMLHYEDAVFELAGVPVAWLPYFSHPDPTVTRKSGFLAPSFDQSTLYGASLTAPYFWAIDPSRDMTFAPRPTSKDGPILGTEYRQRFDFGGFALRGSIGLLDTAADGGTEWRGHVFGDGRFDVAALGPGAQAGFDLAAASDKGYLRRYDIDARDRLETEAFLETHDREGYARVAGAFFQTLRDSEEQDEIPVMLPEFALRRRVADPSGLGELTLGASGVQLMREDGRDVGRLSVDADWERREVLEAGFVGRAFGRLRGDLYHVADDPDLDGTVARFAPHAGAELFYPLVSSGPLGFQLIEPGAQFVAATNRGDDEIPNEDSLIVEFDETNLFDVNRFPGRDRIEGGTRLNLGLRYARTGDDPLRLDASLGRVFRLSKDSSFSDGSGLAERRSDYVIGWGVGWGRALSLQNRLRLSDDFDVNRNEIALRAGWGPARLRASYVDLDDDATAGAEEDREEAALGGELDLTRRWTVGGFGRRDLENDANVAASFGVAYRTDCAAVEFFVRRDFTETDEDPASTTFGLRARVLGGAGGASRRSALCAPDAPEPEAPDPWSDTFLSRFSWR